VKHSSERGRTLTVQSTRNLSASALGGLKRVITSPMCGKWSKESKPPQTRERHFHPVEIVARAGSQDDPSGLGRPNSMSSGAAPVAGSGQRTGPDAPSPAIVRKYQTLDAKVLRCAGSMPPNRQPGEVSVIAVVLADRPVASGICALRLRARRNSTGSRKSLRYRCCEHSGAGRGNFPRPGMDQSALIFWTADRTSQPSNLPQDISLGFPRCEEPNDSTQTREKSAGGFYAPCHAQGAGRPVSKYSSLKVESDDARLDFRLATWS